MAEENTNKVQALLTELAGARILEEILQKTIATLTEKDYRLLAAALIEKVKETPSLDWRVEEEIRKAFWASEAAKDMSAKWEPKLLDHVNRALGAKIEHIAVEIGSAWLRPLLDKIRKSFTSWMDQQ